MNARHENNGRLTATLWGAAVWILALVTVTCLASWPRKAESPTAPGAASEAVAEAVATGFIISPSPELKASEARVIFSWLGDDGRPLWSTSIAVEKDGSFAIGADHLPPLPATTASWAGRLAAEAPGHRAAAVDLRFRSSEGDVRIEPARIALHLEPLEPWLALLLLMPALAALGLAILHLRHRDVGVPAWVYALVCGGSWLSVSLSFAIIFALREQHWIPLFLPDAQASSGLLIFAFFGCLVYLAFSVYQREPDYFTAETSEVARDQLLRTVGGRLLAAPYVALVAWLLLANVFPTLRAGAEVLFFGFFTGLWIKVVLDFLDRVGRALLSQAALDRLRKRHEREEAPELPAPPVRRAAYLPPARKDYLDAVDQARRELHDNPAVIGVGPGHRVSRRDGQTDEEVITVYVEEKKELEPDDPDRIPSTIAGIRTDVVVPAAPAPGECDETVASLFWDKLTPVEAEAAGDAPAAALPETVWEGDVLVLTHPGARAAYYVRSVSDIFRLFSPRRAYMDVAQALGDHYHFVAFVLDAPWGLHQQRNYYIPVYNEVRGIDFYRERPGGSGTFPDRHELGSEKLFGFQVHGDGQLRLRNLLHELGHAWLSYVPNGSGRYDLLDGSKLHWSHKFDDSFPWTGHGGVASRGASCMGYKKRLWLERPDSRFEYRVLDDESGEGAASPESSPFGFCALELYLMGLAPPSDIGPLRLIEPHLGGAEPIPGQSYEASPIAISPQDVLAASGPREPAFPATRREYRQVFVVVTTDRDRGIARAREVDRIRLDHARNVALKTHQQLTLRTEKV